LGTTRSTLQNRPLAYGGSNAFLFFVVMPTYEYICRHCGHEFDKFQSMLDKPFKKCPKCGKNTLKRLIGAGAGLIFKGTGFYTTDYKKSSSPKGTAAKSAGGEGKTSGGDSAPKPAAEAKPAPAPKADSKS
jgi:putative FmdB family regulatory protein